MMLAKIQKIRQEIQELKDDSAKRHKAYEFAQGDELSGEALIKQALGYLYDVPADRVILRPGHLSKTGFIEGHFIRFAVGARPLVQPLPVPTESIIPVITRIEDIDSAFDALEKTLHNVHEGLHEHALYLSTQELIEAYKTLKPLTLEKIPQLLGKLSYRFSKMGYTGFPYSQSNTLCAQLAWLAVDKTKRNPQEQFWKLLYPQITGCYGIMADAHWPAYGEAILDDNLANGMPGEIINYRQFYHEVNTRKTMFRFPATMPESLTNRIKSFHSGHYGFWFCEEQADSDIETQRQSPKKFRTYLEFFLSLKDFAFRNSEAQAGKQFEHQIKLQADDEFLRDYIPGLTRFLDWHENKDYLTKKSDETILKSKGFCLIQITKNLSDSNSILRCLNRNSNDLNSAFKDNELLEDFLKSIPFTLLLSHTQMDGQDDLDYLSTHCLFIKDLDRAGLLHLIKHGKNLPMHELALCYEVLPIPLREDESIPNRGAALFNFCFYVNDLKKEKDFVEALLNNGHYLRFEVITLEGHAPLLKLYDRLSLYEAYQGLFTQILKQDEAQADDYFYGLVYVAHKDLSSFKFLLELESKLWMFSSQRHAFINTSKNDQEYINQVLKALPPSLDFQDKREEIRFYEILFCRINPDKQIFVFNYYKDNISALIKTLKDFKHLREKLPDLEDAIYKILKENAVALIKNPDDLYYALHNLSHDEILDFIPFFCNIPSDTPFFKDTHEFFSFLRHASPTHNLSLSAWSYNQVQNVPLYLKPFIDLYIYDLDTLKEASEYFHMETFRNIFPLLKNKIPDWITDGDSLVDIVYGSPSVPYSGIPDVFLALLLSGRLAGLITEKRSAFLIATHLKYTAENDELWKPVARAIDAQILTQENVLSFLRRLHKPGDPEFFIDLLKDKIKKLLTDCGTLKTLFLELPLEVFKTILSHTDPHILQSMTLDDYIGFHNSENAPKIPFTLFWLKPVRERLLAQPENVVKSTPKPWLS